MVARKTKQYVETAVESLTLAIELFNRPSPIGREHATVMMAAHAFEMLLKAAIYEQRKKVKFSGSDRSFDLGKCVTVAETSLGVIDDGDRVVLHALKDDRDTATHDVIVMSEDVLWLHLRSAVTIFRKVLLGLTGQDLTDVMPGRVLPVSATPPTDVGLVVGKEAEQIAELLGPGKRRSAEARARLLPLMSLDRAARGETEPLTEEEINRTLRGLKEGSDWTSAFPGVVSLRLVGSTRPSDQVQEISLRVDPKRGKVPVRPAREGEEAAAYREVDTFDRYSLKLSKLGEKLGLTQSQGYAVVHHLDLKSDPACYRSKTTPKGNITWQGLSNLALERARKALDDGLDVDAAVVEYNARNDRKAKKKR
ncbi:DUF3644 domain-containing protein [Corynebacterium meridianum]|uniref:DUF3644 domain-containing protein n=1 Tax=Corynebacterium meridianum TaxID=2765363 RepID=A0A934I3E5_9CORY|nr:DUF3644 domain-containing protein [Corynebacterium meridianum]MBI8988439.1 hypothetical protein [Corynebacterium meridianum]